MAKTGRPRKTMHEKVAENAHISNAEKAAGLEMEVFAAKGDILPPSWLSGLALDHFLKMADFMRRKNAIAKASIYGDIDTEALAMMCVSYQRAFEAMEEEGSAESADVKAKAQRRRISENKNYREFMSKLQLDPSSRPFLPEKDGGGDGESEYADIL